MKFGIGSARAADLGTGATAALSASGAFEATATNLSANQSLIASDLLINNVNIGASSSDDDNLSSGEKAASALAKVAAINRASAQTGVSAVVGKTVMTGSAMTAAALTGTVTINGKETASITTTTSAAANRTLVADAINAISGQTGVRAIDTGDDNAGIRLEAADGRNVIVSFDTGALTAATTGLKTGAQSGSFNLVSNNGEPIEISSTSAGRVSRSGLQVGTYERGISGVTTDSRAVATNAASAFTLNSGDLNINGVAIRGATADDDTFSDDSALSSKKAGSAIAIAAAINASSAETGVTARANSLTLDGSAPTTVIAATADRDAGHQRRPDRHHARCQRHRPGHPRECRAGDQQVQRPDRASWRRTAARAACRLTAEDGRNIAVAFDSDEAARPPTSASATSPSAAPTPPIPCRA